MTTQKKKKKKVAADDLPSLGHIFKKALAFKLRFLLWECLQNECMFNRWCLICVLKTQHFRTLEICKLIVFFGLKPYVVLQFINLKAEFFLFILSAKNLHFTSTDTKLLYVYVQ